MKKVEGKKFYTTLLSNVVIEKIKEIKIKHNINQNEMIDIILKKIFKILLNNEKDEYIYKILKNNKILK
jgi:hypothetical protein